jgi:hypothetical protein
MLTMAPTVVLEIPSARVAGVDAHAEVGFEVETKGLS